MTFRDALARHLRAIQERDIDALSDTVAHDGVVVVTAEGRLVRSVQEFLDMHREWFQMRDWSMTVTPVDVFEGPQIGTAIFRLDYRETPPDRPEVRQESYLTLIFQERGGRWVMVQDQNTPIKQR